MGPTPVGNIVGAIPAAILGALSAVRGRRIFHPVGVAYSARARMLQVEPDLQVLPAGEHEAIVRFSRGAGLPPSLPDVLGISIKLRGLSDDGDQDLLLVSSAQLPVLRRLLIPTASFHGRRFSSVLSYRFREGSPLLIGGVVEAEDFPRARLDDPDEAPLLPAVTVHLEVATNLGPWSRVASVEVGERLSQAESDALRFDPWHTSEDLRPAGALNAVRAPAYRLSQLARSLFGWRQTDPRRDGAEEEVERIPLSS